TRSAGNLFRTRPRNGPAAKTKRQMPSPLRRGSLARGTLTQPLGPSHDVGDGQHIISEEERPAPNSRSVGGVRAPRKARSRAGVERQLPSPVHRFLLLSVAGGRVQQDVILVGVALPLSGPA